MDKDVFDKFMEATKALMEELKTDEKDRHRKLDTIPEFCEELKENGKDVEKTRIRLIFSEDDDSSCVSFNGSLLNLEQDLTIIIGEILTEAAERMGDKPEELMKLFMDNLVERVKKAFRR